MAIFNFGKFMLQATKVIFDGPACFDLLAAGKLLDHACRLPSQHFRNQLECRTAVGRKPDLVKLVGTIQRLIGEASVIRIARMREALPEHGADTAGEVAVFTLQKIAWARVLYL